MWRGLLISLSKWMIYIYQILEKWDSKGDFDIAYSAVMGIGLNAYLKKFIFSGQRFGCANFKADKSYISHLRNIIALTGNSALLRNMTILNLITPYILFQ